MKTIKKMKLDTSLARTLDSHFSSYNEHFYSVSQDENTSAHFYSVSQDENTSTSDYIQAVNYMPPIYFSNGIIYYLNSNCYSLNNNYYFT